MTANSTLRERPAKPRPDFPLFPHRCGHWAKKINGKFSYFGRWADDPKGAAALKLWQEQEDALRAGVRPNKNAMSIMELCERFLTQTVERVERGARSPRTLADYHSVCGKVIDEFGGTTPVEGITVDHFNRLLAKLSFKIKKKIKDKEKQKERTRVGPHALARQVTIVRMIFKFARTNNFIEKEINFGTAFAKPDNKEFLKHRQESRLANGKRMFEAKDLRKIIDSASLPLKAMILLGVNCGFGNHDCGTLPIGSLDLQRGWIDFPRPKTRAERRSPLWKETVDAINESLAVRPSHRDKADSHLVFVTPQGLPWAKDVADSPITKEFRKLLDELKLYRPGLGFYALRHTFETIGGATGDQVAVNALMGHSDNSMAATYRESISDQRLKAVTTKVYRWLFGAKKRS